MLSEKHRALQVNSLQLLFYQTPLSVTFLTPIIAIIVPLTSEHGLFTVWSYDVMVWTSQLFKSTHYSCCSIKLLCLSHSLHPSLLSLNHWPVNMDYSQSGLMRSWYEHHSSSSQLIRVVVLSNSSVCHIPYTHHCYHWTTDQSTWTVYCLVLWHHGMNITALQVNSLQLLYYQTPLSLTFLTLSNSSVSHIPYTIKLLCLSHSLHPSLLSLCMDYSRSGLIFTYVHTYVRTYTFFSGNNPQVRPFDRFWRVMTQKTRNRARMCLLGVTKIKGDI